MHAAPEKTSGHTRDRRVGEQDPSPQGNPGDCGLLVPALNIYARHVPRLLCAVVGTIACLIKVATGVVPIPAAVLGGVIYRAWLCRTASSLSRLSVGNPNSSTTFLEAIELMVRGVKAGLPVAESIKTASQETPEPVKSELAKIVDAIRIGRKLNDVLSETSRRSRPSGVQILRHCAC